jgi:hypothetical protein
MRIWGQHKLWKSLHFCQNLTIGNFMGMIKYKITGSSTTTFHQAYYKNLQCNNRGTGEGAWLANHRNSLFAT